SGSGTNLSKLRGSQEYLSGGGRASGPVSFMRGFDAFAGVIKSGGKTRRAAKMVILNIDHPDIVEFIECKAKEEQKAWALIEAGYDPGFNVPGGAYDSVFFQNANHSVRVTDEFMRAVEEDREWHTIARTTGEALATYRARDLFRKIAEAAWVCGDPGLQFHDTTNKWHTVKNSGQIHGSNPCFTGDSLVYTDKGLVRFRELLQRVAQGDTFWVYTHNATASPPSTGVRLSLPTQFMVTGVHEVWRLRFSNGIEVRCTPHHRFFTRNRGMVRADELTSDDQVLVVDAPCLPVNASWQIPCENEYSQLRAKGERRAPLNLPAEWSEPLAELLGHLTGDGSFVPSTNMIVWIYGSPEDREHLLPRHKAVLESLGLRPNICQQRNGTVQMRVQRAVLNRFFESLGMRRATAQDKHVLASLFQAPAPIIAAYLRGLFSADGCVHDDQKKGTCYVGLASRSYALLQEVQQLLLMFGIQSRIYTQKKRDSSFRYTRKRDNKQMVYDSRGNTYDLRITSSSLRRFCEYIGFSLPRKQQALARWISTHGFYNIPQDAQLQEREPIGYELTFNLTEPIHHTYLVNGLVVANCSEFVFLDDTSCNLASLNLLKFRLPNGDFDIEAFRAAVRIFITAQEIIVDNSAYPTEKIADNSHNFRPLGLGYANLGALLMSLGLPYDSDAGRAYAAILTAIMHGEAYRQSAIIARECGAPFPAFELNREPMLEVMRMHADALNSVQAELVPPTLMSAARAIWRETLQLGEQHGYRNAQVTVLAPTGTIAFMMDCDTTGIEPDIALVKYKTLVGGGLLKIVNTTVPLALQQLGYSSEAIEAITRYIDEHDTIEGAPYLKPEHLPVFDCAFRPAKGVRSLAPIAHVKMMAAVQPFLSGAISKTVNMPHDATPEDIEQIYLQAWKMGLKAIAIYRDGSKRTQPLSTKKPDEVARAESERPVRRRLPDERQSITHKFSVAGHEGYITVGMYEDGTPGEIFLTMAKEGSVISGLMDAFATAISLALQYGVPLEKLVEKFSYTRFQPSGFTNNPQIPVATSIVDYIFRWLAMKFLQQQPTPPEPLHENGVGASTAEPIGVQGGVGKPDFPHGQGAKTTDWSKLVSMQQDAPPCPNCGMIMVRTGACYSCYNCGVSFGCG
ncbi:MAG: LAGLIDADG family homing endonuclease, partial [Fimbriimonadales bacterium]